LSGINYFIVDMITKWTTHSDNSLLMVWPYTTGISLIEADSTHRLIRL
jgi:hypothetical protein